MARVVELDGEHAEQRDAGPVILGAGRAEVADFVPLVRLAASGAVVEERDHAFPFSRATSAA